MPIKKNNGSKSKASSVRNSPVPKPANIKPTTGPTSQKRTITAEMIAERAYFIHLSGTGGSDYDNWVRAERELHAGK